MTSACTILSRELNTNYVGLERNGYILTRTNVASVGSVFNDTRKVKVLSLPETIKEKSTFRAKALRRELVVGPSLETSIFPLSFQVVREPLPFAATF